MISALPKLLGRRFLIAHFLPVLVFSILSIVVVDGLEGGVALLMRALSQAQLGLSLLGLILFLALVLSLANRVLIRTLEGYGWANPLRLLLPIQRRQFLSLKRKLASIAQKAALDPLEAKTIQRRNAVLRRLARSFPDDELYLLPTSFGNTIRAFEVYPRVLYGFEGVSGWFRLMGVVPNEFREMIEEAKAIVDLWVNVLALSTLAVVLSLSAWAWNAFLGSTSLIPAAEEWAVATAATAAAVFAYRRAVAATHHWGQWVCGGYDLFLPSLAKALGFSEGRSLSSVEWNLWSRAMIYREPKRLDELREQLRIGGELE